MAVIGQSDGLRQIDVDQSAVQLLASFFLC
jgi:hypothetical protein